MKDDALAPVVAMMLILAVVVTLFSLWNSVYLPGLKQQAEVEHLSQVEEGMERFDSAISDALFYQRSGSLSIPIPLGGGDIMFNGVRSGGCLRIGKEPMMNSTLIDTSGNPHPHTANISNVSYTPVLNFWIPQGYTWQYGSLNVTKGNITATLELFDEPGQFANSLFDCTVDDGNLTITTVSIQPGTRNTINGNGISHLKLNASMNDFPQVSVTQITVTLDSRLPEPFFVALHDHVNERLSKATDTKDSNSEQNILTFTGFSNPLNVTVRRMDITLSVE